MKARTLKIFYKGNKLSTLYTGTAHQTVLSANNQNLCETTSLPSQASLLATDAQSSTVNIVSESQTTINYGPYGNDSSPPDNPLLSRFTGQSWLPAAIGYLLGNGHRLFNPGLMRFHSADSFSPFGSGGLNTYTYCGNDPINRVDPSGRFFAKLFKRFNQGYSYKKLAPRLDESSPSLSRNEYNALSNSINKRQRRAESKLDRGLTNDLLHTTENAFQEINKINQQHTILGLLSVDKNRRFNFDTTHLTRELHGHIPVHAGPTSKRAEQILNSPSTLDPSIPEDLVHQELLERLRRLRQG
ncbi:RHS repeat-associated core domain-containing protein [Pseudomonas sp. WOUb67]|uniref:RHS repeat-associated core domain-containing protein n=1 Tax=Pseudomonas sp. WOUb67 TaxID=3161136 RepID=UPI003CEAD70F